MSHINLFIWSTEMINQLYKKGWTEFELEIFF